MANAISWFIIKHAAICEWNIIKLLPALSQPTLLKQVVSNKRHNNPMAPLTVNVVPSNIVSIC